jgi:hypothetical protein
MFILFVCGHVFVLVVAFAISLTFRASGAPAGHAFVYALLPIAMAAAIGTALAAVIPHLWSSVLAVVTTYALWYALVVNAAAVPVNVGGATINLAGLVYRGDMLLWSCAVGVVVTGLFLCIAAYAVRRQSFGQSLTAFALVTSAVIIGGTLAGTGMPSSRFKPADSVEFVCEGASPQVCLSDGHAARIRETAAGVQEAADVLTGVGVNLEGVVLREDLVESQPGEDGVLLMAFGQLNGIGTTELDYALSLVRPVDCAEYYREQPTPELDRLMSASGLIGDWLSSTMAGGSPPIADDLVAALYSELRECSVSEELLERVDLR